MNNEPHESGNEDEDESESSVRTVSTTVSSLWTTQQNHRRLWEKYLLGEDNCEAGENTSEEIVGPSLHPPSTSFCRLNVATNLNQPPSNWLMSGTQGHVPLGVNQLSGFDPTIHSTGFSSFRMASHFLECLGLEKFGVDVVSDAENIKKLLKMPYSSNAVSMVVHRIGKTLLIDELDLHRILLTPDNEEWEWLRKFFVETILDIIESRERAVVRRNKSRDAIIERNLFSKFLYRSLNPPTSSSDENSEKETTKDDETESALNESPYKVNLPPLPEPAPEDVEPKFVEPNHDFARKLLWNFEDIRMLIGSDMPIFGDADHPSVSLRLHNMQRPINILTGLDYWLDNLMCQVPEVLMCFHLDGIVQRYELIKTEELPKYSENCKFSPRTIRDVAKNILAFLKSNAAKEGHTYWLFKAKDDDVVKLYDLTSLCEEAEDSRKEGKRRGAKKSAESCDNTQNPFRTAVSMLLYKVARNIMTGSERKEEEASAQKLLIKCLELLDEEKYPHIATSAHYLLSDIFIPDDIDPSSVSPEDSSAEDEYDEKKLGVKEFSTKRRISCPNVSNDGSSAMVAIQNLCKSNSVKNEQRSDDRFSSTGPDTPVLKSTRERCIAALEHLVSGLNSLETFADKQMQEDATEEKKREQHERDHPTMARPNVAIPMSFASSSDGISKHNQIALKTSDGRILLSTKLELSWHDHLKAALLRKAFLVYVMMAETNFLRKYYGKTLRCVKRAINCRNMVRQLEEISSATDVSTVLSFAYGIAGDSYMALVQTWSKDIVMNIDQYNAENSKCETDLINRVEKHLNECNRDWLIKVPTDIEESLNLSVACLKKSLGCLPTQTEASDQERDNVLKRLANVSNELGVFYMNQASSLAKQSTSEQNLNDALSNLLSKSRQHLEEGVHHFESLGDYSNQALLLSNLGRLHRVRAYCYSFQTDKEKTGGDSKETAEFSDEESSIYHEAISCYQKALSVLGARKRTNLAVFDTVSWELSTTHYTLGCQLQDYAPLSRKSRPELVRQIADHYAKSLKFCDLDTVDESRLPIFQYRVASVHSRLAALYHHCLRLDPTSGHYKQLADSHYDKAFSMFRAVEDLEEVLRCILEQISLQEFFMEEMHPTRKSFHTIFCLLAQSLPVLKSLKERTVTPAGDDSQEIEKLLRLLVQRCQSNLLALNKFLSASSVASLKHKKTKNVEKLNWAKQLYTSSLKLPSSDNPNFLTELCSFFDHLSEETKNLK